MGHKVLIVDDSATMRKIIMRGLRQAGLEISDFLEAADGVEALSMLESSSVDLILSDINMPNMNGLDFIKAVQSQGGDSPPVVMITTEGSDGVIKEAMDRGAKGYLRKPFTPDKIQEVIGPFLGKPDAKG